MGDSHTVTATLTDGTGTPQSGIDVTFEVVSGPNSGATGTAATDSNGEATFTYTGNETGTDVIRACYTNNENQTICSQTVTKVWNPQQIQELNIVLEPNYDLNLVGENHTVTATVTDESNTPQSGIDVTFEVISGPNAGASGTTGSSTTNTSGEATFTYTGDEGVGTDSIQACFFFDGQEICSDVVQKEWTEETIDITPLLDTNPVGTDHTVTATVQDLKGRLLEGILVTFTIRDGPNQGKTDTDLTDENGEATYTYTDTEGPGTDAIRACFTNAAGQEVCTDYGNTFDNDAFKEWEIDDPVCPSIKPNPATLPDGVVDGFYSQTLTGFGGSEPYTFSVTAGSLPPGLTLTSAGLLSGTPTQDGTFSFTITATDSNNCQGSREYTLTINPFECPTISISPATLPGGDLGDSYSQAITASGGDGSYTFTLTSGSLPTGLSLSGAGVISGSLEAEGTYNFTVTATDSNNCQGSLNYTINVNPEECPTIAVSPEVLPGGNLGDSYSQELSGSGGEEPYTFDVIAGALPQGLNLSVEGVLSGTLTQGITVNFTISATDAKGCEGIREYTVEVCPSIGLEPSSLSTAAVGESYSQQLTGTGGIAPYDFEITAGNLPSGLTLSPEGILSGTPSQDNDDTEFNFTVTATDVNGCEGSRDYTLLLCPGIILGPEMDDELPTGFVSHPYNVTINASEPGATFELTGDLPPGLSGSSGSYVISGTPTEVGTWEFAITASTGIGCAETRHFKIEILSAAAIPTLSEWGMIILVGVLAAMSVILIRRRQTA